VAVAYSGTISKTVFNTGKVIDSAVRRCKVPAQKITSEMIEIATNELYLFLSQLANQRAPLWCTVKTIYPLYEGLSGVETIPGTIDVYTATLRTTSEVTEGTYVDTPSGRLYTFETPTWVTTVGIKWAGPSKPMAFARSDDNVAFKFVPPDTTINPASAGEWTWFDLESTAPALYFLVQTEDLSNFPFFELYIGNNPSEIPMGRINRDDYVNLPNKTFPSNRPLQFWLDRQVDTPVLRLWPVPNAQAIHSQMVIWSHRHIMDVGSLTMIPITAGAAQIALQIAQGEERDNSTKRIAPNFSAYTA
jgi:hypothetical protein